MKRALEGAVVFLIGAIGIWGALKVPSAAPGETWAGLFPMFASAALVGIGAALATGAMKAAPSGVAKEMSEQSGDASNMWKVFALLVISLAYFQTITLFGYLIPTAIAAPLVLSLFGVRSPLGLAISAVVCPLVFHVIFFEGLGVFPPYGEAFDLLDVIQG